MNTFDDDAGSVERTLTRTSEEEGLLFNWKREEGQDDIGHEPSVSPEPNVADAPRRLNLRWMVLVILAFCALALVISIGTLLSLRHVANESNTGVEPIKPPNDYLLDPAWDFGASPQRRVFRWTVRDHIYNPDGVYRPMILINKQFPGPLIEVNEGDTIAVHIDNQATNATAFHWHGIFQRGTPDMDGTVGVTQCPIPPGGKFTYEFTISGQSGTYWYHAHYGVQAADGLYGPLIVHARNEKQLQRLGYATDRVVMISDHYHDLSTGLLWQYLKPDMENAEPVPHSGIINGMNTIDCDKYPHRECHNDTANVGTPSLNLPRGQKHRIRLINTGAFAEFQLQIDEHQLEVTEVDGTNVVPVSYHRISINPAQRYSVIVDASAPTADTFWLRARMVTTCFAYLPENLETEIRAIVRYEDHDNKQLQNRPNSKDWAEAPEIDCKDMNTSDLRPVEAIPAPEEPDAFFYLRSNFEIGAYRLSRGFFNESSWRPDIRSPTLLRSIDGLSTEDSLFTHAGAGTFINDAAFDSTKELVVQTTGIQTIDLLISNFDDGNHPLHLHGYKYFVLAEGDGYPPLAYPGADINYENLGPLYQSLDLSNPLRRDTASVQAFGWILIRFVADNPGSWALHCHVSWHTEAGLLMQFLTRTDELAKMKVSDASSALCRAPNLEKGQGPSDSAYEDLA